MKLPDLSDNPEAAKKQWRAARSLIYSQEKQISHYRRRVQELEKELSLVDKTEIDALYETIEKLTSQLEKEC
jgi:polyhydroxyalkanoate synthesis regulator phasin